jgi:hypothetical protein
MWNLLGGYAMKESITTRKKGAPKKGFVGFIHHIVNLKKEF